MSIDAEKHLYFGSAPLFCFSVVADFWGRRNSAFSVLLQRKFVTLSVVHLRNKPARNETTLSIACS